MGGRVYVEMYYPKSNQTEPHSNITNPTELVTTFFFISYCCDLIFLVHKKS